MKKLNIHLSFENNFGGIIPELLYRVETKEKEDNEKLNMVNWFTSEEEANEYVKRIKGKGGKIITIAKYQRLA